MNSSPVLFVCLLISSQSKPYSKTSEYNDILQMKIYSDGGDLYTNFS